MSSNACPVCHQSDKTQKVTAILRAQTRSTTGTIERENYYTDSSGQLRSYTKEDEYSRTEISSLASMLFPPKQPQSQLLPKPSLAPSITCSTVFFIALGSMGVSLGVLVFGALIYWWTTGSIHDIGLIAMIAGTGLVVVVYGAVVVFKYLKIALVPKSIRNAKHKAALSYWQNQNSQAKAEQQAWNLAMERWSQLYYCERDDCVFLPGTETSAPIGEMHQYLYK